VYKVDRVYINAPQGEIYAVQFNIVEAQPDFIQVARVYIQPHNTPSHRSIDVFEPIASGYTQNGHRTRLTISESGREQIGKSFELLYFCRTHMPFIISERNLKPGIRHYFFSRFASTERA
jgi:hypothetical protein